MTTRPFVVDAALSAMAVNFTNPSVSLIADEIMPRVDVGGETYKYDYFPPDEVFTVPDTTVGRRGAVPQVEFSAEQRTGSVVDRGLDSPVPQSDIDSAARQRARGESTYDPEARAVEGLTHLLQLDRELRVANIVTNVANYDADKRVALAGGDKWNTATSDPVADIKTAQDATFIARPNIAACSRAVFTALSTNPKILKSVNRNDGDAGVASRRAIADLFELDEIYVGDGFFNTARKGQAGAYSRVWGNHFSLMHRNMVASNNNGIPTFGFTAEWRRFGGSSMMSGRIANAMSGGVQGGQNIRVAEAVEEHVVSPSVAYLISAPI